MSEEKIVENGVAYSAEVEEKYSLIARNLQVRKNYFIKFIIDLFGL